MDKNIIFKLDARVDVTFVSQTVFNKIFSNSQQKPWFGPGQIPQDVSRLISLRLRIGTKQTMEKVYVVKNLNTSSLWLPAIVALGLLIRVDSIDMETLKAGYPKLCSSPGEVQ